MERLSISSLRSLHVPLGLREDFFLLKNLYLASVKSRCSWARLEFAESSLLLLGYIRVGHWILVTFILGYSTKDPDHDW